MLRLTKGRGGFVCRASMGHVSARLLQYILALNTYNGILNILDRYRELYGSDPDAVISGFHMSRKPHYSQADLELVRQTGEELRKLLVRFYFTVSECAKGWRNTAQRVQSNQLKNIDFISPPCYNSRKKRDAER